MGNITLPLLPSYQAIVCFGTLLMFGMDLSVDGDFSASCR